MKSETKTKQWQLLYYWRPGVTIWSNNEMAIKVEFYIICKNLSQYKPWRRATLSASYLPWSRWLSNWISERSVITELVWWSRQLKSPPLMGRIDFLENVFAWVVMFKSISCTLLDELRSIWLRGIRMLRNIIFLHLWFCRFNVSHVVDIFRRTNGDFIPNHTSLPDNNISYHENLITHSFIR